jgi:predicted nucleic acid-binding protein
MMTNFNNSPHARNDTLQYTQAARAQFSRQRSPLHRDNTLREAGMKRRHRSLPSVKAEVSAWPDDGRPIIIADCNIEPDIVDYLRNEGFAVVPIADTKAHGSPDAEIYAFAAQNGVMLVTHDKDFTNFGNLNLEDSPGVIILPQKSWKKALGHFVDHMVHSVDLWRGKVGEYRADKILAVHMLPFRATALKEPLPTVMCYNYGT